MRRKKIVLGFALGALACALSVGIYTVAAPSWDVPQTLHFEGVLVDDTGSPVAGPVTIIFRIFDAATGGTPLWEERHDNTPVRPGGIVERTLGERNAITDNMIAGDRWLEVQVGVSGTPLSPRLKLHAVPFARRAGESARIAAGTDLDEGKIAGGRVADLVSTLQGQVTTLTGTLTTLQAQLTTQGNLITAQGAEIATLKDTSCPPGYTPVSGVCTKGADEMVKVGDFWIDRYESIVVDAAYWNNGQCNGTGTIYGDTDDWSTVASFPFTGNWTGKLYSCSKTGVPPSRYLTWFQAQQALAASGKHLCTNGEWQAAAAGTPDPGASSGTGGLCVTDGAYRNTGLGSGCASKWGAQDMIGNLSEWVDMWGQSGKNGDTTFSDAKYYGTAGSGQGWDGLSPETTGDGDGTWNLNGRAYGCDKGGANCGYKDGLPFAAVRGGDWSTAAKAGVFALSLYDAPSYRTNSGGFRGCRR